MPAVMNFFQLQDQARKKTGRLILLFAAAVTTIVLVTYMAVAFIWVAGVSHATNQTDSNEWTQRAVTHDIWEPHLFALVLGGVVAIVVIGILIKLYQLRTGGRAVAESVGARLIDPTLATGQERKVLNVVEEMAIASGIPVPPVYILDEGGINAFAAGYTPKDAVVCVTKGTVERLDRDELQGVIGHEFSHIFNGDMRLNIKLIGVLNGILAIGLIGWFILRSSMQTSRVGYRRRSKDNGVPMALILVGLAMLIIGYMGTFFGNLIKAAVSRQREFLADASAVQFTRNPSGIAGALKKIGGYIGGSKITHHGAAEVSHMFFSQASVSWLDFMLATHPPLPERIRRIEPTWDGQFEKSVPLKGEVAARMPASALAAAATSPGAAVATASPAGKQGHPGGDNLDSAATLIEQLPESVKTAAHEPFSARALVYAMLIDDDSAAQARQMEYLQAESWRGAADETKRLLADVQTMNDQHRLPALDLAMPALRQLSQSQYDEFCHSVDLLVRADNHIKLFEWTVQKLVVHNLSPQYRPRQASPGAVLRPWPARS